MIQRIHIDIKYGSEESGDNDGHLRIEVRGSVV